ncbi:hypothetical protein Hanom_Chr12g01125041 [Helianthus anomalus]
MSFSFEGITVTPLSAAEARGVIMKGSHCIRKVNILHAHENIFKHYITENISQVFATHATILS